MTCSSYTDQARGYDHIHIDIPKPTIDHADPTVSMYTYNPQVGPGPSISRKNQEQHLQKTRILQDLNSKNPTQRSFNPNLKSISQSKKQPIFSSGIQCAEQRSLVELRDLSSSISISLPKTLSTKARPIFFSITSYCCC